MKLEQYLLEIEQFLRDYLKESHMDGYILGLSGGVDSTLVAAIARKAVGKDKLLCISIPIESHRNDEEDAKKIADLLDINFQVINLTETYLSFKKEIKGEEYSRLTLGNLKARMRMSLLYAIGQEKRFLVLGTDNMDEAYIGYFTKYGDGGADLNPINHLTKREVRDAIKMYGLSDYFSERVATAGLYEGQTDEKEIGFTYDELDAYLLGKEINPEVIEKIERLHRISEHKRKPIPTPKPFIRD